MPLSLGKQFAASRSLQKSLFAQNQGRWWGLAIALNFHCALNFVHFCHLRCPFAWSHGELWWPEFGWLAQQSSQRCSFSVHWADSDTSLKVIHFESTSLWCSMYRATCVVSFGLREAFCWGSTRRRDHRKSVYIFSGIPSVPNDGRQIHLVKDNDCHIFLYFKVFTRNSLKFRL